MSYDKHREDEREKNQGTHDCNCSHCGESIKLEDDRHELNGYTYCTGCVDNSFTHGDY